jgi:glycogen debranching enzyme
MMDGSEVITLDSRQFVPAEALPITEWPCVITQTPQPTLTLKDDDLFLVIDTLGNISGCLEGTLPASLGLFCRDTRFLSRLELQIDGKAPILLSSDARKGFVLSVLCTNPSLSEQIPVQTVAIEREIVLNGGLFEEIRLSNHSTQPIHFELSLSFAADFVDLFEIRGFGRDRRGQLLHPVPQSIESDHRNLILAYQGLDQAVMASQIYFFDPIPDQFKGHTAIWQVELAPHQTSKLGYRLLPTLNYSPASAVSPPMTLIQAKAAEMLEEQTWYQNATQIRTDFKAFNQVIERAEQDIYLLRQTFEKGQVLSAGVPWFSTLFGRDSIIAASQTLILDPAIARSTLAILAEYQGQTHNDWTEEEPGKILHEIRLGEMARCHEIPHAPYYGTIDATPLWLMLYAEYYAWTHDLQTLEQLWPNALAAMDWIDRNCQETGYLSYHCRSTRGLVNQGWKDSGDCIVDHRGQLAKGPIALCEVQGYIYAAKVRLSELARLRKQPELADRWQQEAADLKTRFSRDFWLPDQGFCALALDGMGNPVDSITSNPGHCLSLGILLPEQASSIAERLQAPDMFNGWGIRTLSSLSPAYNPMGYHVGSIWPHDNGFIVQGLRSLGFIEPALELSQALMDMTLQQPYLRPPELFCGYERTTSNIPVRYPVACSPQAWATGTIFQLLRTILNLVPDAPGNYLRILDPALPTSINHITLHNLRIGSTLVDLEFERTDGTVACRVLKKRGNLRVVIEA